MDKCGFPAGTRVVTDKGLTRIEDIKIGDLLLSKSENGEQVFKPITKIVIHEDVEIFELTYAIVKNTTKPHSLSDTNILNASKKGKVFGIRVSANHLFHSENKGWTAVKDLKKGQLLTAKNLELFNYVILSAPEFQTTDSEITASLGFTSVTKLSQFDDKTTPQYSFQVYDDKGDCQELLDGKSSRSPIKIDNKGEIFVTEKLRLATAYDLEIADNHNYYVFDKLLVKSL